MDKGTNIMETQQFSGTVRHASPELFLDNKYNTLSDMWCFGIVVYEVNKPYHFRCLFARLLGMVRASITGVSSSKSYL